MTQMVSQFFSDSLNMLKYKLIVNHFASISLEVSKCYETVRVRGIKFNFSNLWPQAIFNTILLQDLYIRTF